VPRTPRGHTSVRPDAVFSAVAAGDLSVRIGGRYPLGRRRRAPRDLQSNRTPGKLLLLP
jgi:NADPH:quinone reductase